MRLLAQQLVVDYGIRFVYSKIKYKHPVLYESILEHNKTEKQEITFAEKLYRYVHNLKERPKCVGCGINPVKSFYGYNKGYSPFCSRKCASRHQGVINKRKQTLKTKYGTDKLVDVRWEKDS